MAFNSQTVETTITHRSRRQLDEKWFISIFMMFARQVSALSLPSIRPNQTKPTILHSSTCLEAILSSVHALFMCDRTFLWILFSRHSWKLFKAIRIWLTEQMHFSFQFIRFGVLWCPMRWILWGFLQMTMWNLTRKSLARKTPLSDLCLEFPLQPTAFNSIVWQTPTGEFTS